MSVTAVKAALPACYELAGRQAYLRVVGVTRIGCARHGLHGGEPFDPSTKPATTGP